MHWFLRKEDKTVYGPVDIAVLAGWAASGRITPSDEISNDQAIWRPAPELAELKMEWRLEIGDGETFGPIHALALAELVRDGSVPAEQPARHAQHGTVSTAGTVAVSALLTVVKDLEAGLERWQERANRAETERDALQNRPPPPPDPELARLRQALAEADARIVELVKQTVHVPDPEAPRLRESLRQAEDRIAELETKRQVMDHVAMADGTVDAGTLLKSYRELSQNYDRLLGKLNDKSDELSGALESHARAVKDLKAQLASAHEGTQKERQELEATRARLVALEQAHVEIVRAYRDLNDRYIRLRQVQSEAGPAGVPPSPGDKPKVRLV